MRAQGARGEQAVAAYEKAVFTAYGDAEKGLTTLQSDERRVALLKDATDKARFAYDAARKGYGLGLTDLTILVQAEQGWRQTRAAYTGAATSSLVDAVATFKALGGGWPASAEMGRSDEDRDAHRRPWRSPPSSPAGTLAGCGKPAPATGATAPPAADRHRGAGGACGRWPRG